ncbi:cobalamin-dependent protein [Acuticoccus yangtzensis]|uniref:cobalamin-dependent protein n=1 Tax=Acuticoccus yangtzensis TaxID=1443441 RepID=UPI0009499A26|nr:cobalamin-dependent protein [Acuticoccus yangtzensis]
MSLGAASPAVPTLTAPALRPGADLLAEGRAMARDWRLGRCLFLDAEGVPSEAAYKRRTAREGRIMRHAHIGFRSVERTVGAMADLADKVARRGARIDRFGVTLDWTMGYPQERRAAATRGTGIVLAGPEDFARITNAAPAAPHFGDFMLGLPGAVENVRAAIAAGATAIGNLGQYFTFRLPHWDDDVATTEATVIALGLIAAQDAEILVHSNLDDGFAGLFMDMASAVGMVIVEKHIVEDLIGAKASFCFGHHFSHPLSRAAFQAAVARLTDTPGTMIFGNTVAYRAEPAANYASLASYLLADIVALMRRPSGHAINPVPVTENVRIPDVDEILDAQLFADRLVAHAADHVAAVDAAAIEALADTLVAGGKAFAARALAGLAERGVDTADPAALMLAIRRAGPKRMEAWFGAAAAGDAARPLVPAEWAEELDRMARDWAVRQAPALAAGVAPEASAGVAPDAVAGRAVTVIVGTTDVHEHGAYLVRRALEQAGIGTVDGGVAVDPEALVEAARAAAADIVAISTYNGVGLSYVREVMAALAARGMDCPVMIGGKLNGIPDASNSSLPVDLTDEIRAAGAVPCADLDDMVPVILTAASRRSAPA